MKKNLLCFSHLRWNFVYQRPQHLMSRFAQYQKVYFLEEPMFDTDYKPSLTLSNISDDLWLVVPHLPSGLSKEEANEMMTLLLDNFLQNKTLSDFTFWYYTPMALEFSSAHQAGLTVFDCMDELSAFDFAPKELKQLEKELMRRADLVFTGGHSLYEAKKHQHSAIYPFPSSIEKSHFEKARNQKSEPADQCDIPGPVLGFYGVIDERFDINLIREIALQRPEWQIVLIGPVVKIDPGTLPQADNIHYLGQKTYNQLPAYLSGWDIALIPFLLNESTRFISPTKTPEYLAAGIPVVSTPIRDVIDPYGVNNLIKIGANPGEFIAGIEQELNKQDYSGWLKKVDNFLRQNSWDKTFMAMNQKMEQQLAVKPKVSIAS
ncbi:glycosyltransferase family 1 protein [Hufsiella ginkgonis]|uniref:Glycosyltransferase n=1 Tax=Hufsiella ginkgonis TaxID=2695274 RepID=A0A7K1Y0B7_9SPHI|nr:glycosyltransferase family 1 protein [Hufsiella ginkgonis]MXV16673.1 glycosyltransferase [Hufsiella ginkgonis]